MSAFVRSLFFLYTPRTANRPPTGGPGWATAPAAESLSNPFCESLGTRNRERQSVSAGAALAGIHPTTSYHKGSRPETACEGYPGCYGIEAIGYCIPIPHTCSRSMMDTAGILFARDAPRCPPITPQRGRSRKGLRAGANMHLLPGGSAQPSYRSPYVGEPRRGEQPDWAISPRLIRQATPAQLLSDLSPTDAVTKRDVEVAVRPRWKQSVGRSCKT